MPRLDVVIPLGNGSLHNDAELLYTLRGIDMHLKNAGDVYIVGKLPSWKIKNVYHIAAEDNGQKEINIKNKILKACAESAVSDELFFMNDDHFLLKDTDAATYPFYHKGSLADGIQRRKSLNMTGGYFATLQNTFAALNTAKLPATHFDIHTPIRYNKIDFRQICKLYNWDVPGSLAIKSIYSNTKKIRGEHFAECRINKPQNIFELHNRVRDRHIFSIGDGAVNSSLWEYLQQQLPNKSKYEV